MKELYPDMTAEKLLRAIQRKSLLRAMGSLLLLLLFICLLGGIIMEICSDLSQSWFFLLTAPAWILAIYWPFKSVKQHLSEMKSGGQNEVFLRYGSPEEIAAVLSDPENCQLLNYRQVILTKSYLMRRNDFLTYIPLDQIAQITVSVWHGKHPHVYLNVLTREGEEKRYSFEEPMLRLVSRQADEIRMQISEYLSVYAPDCVIL